MLLTLGKHLGQSGEELYEIYQSIPNVAEIEVGSEEYNEMFESDKRLLVITLIPKATEINEDELIKLWDCIKDMYASA